jgi:hypothetical protein
MYKTNAIMRVYASVIADTRGKSKRKQKKKLLFLKCKQINNKNNKTENEERGKVRM